MPRLGDDTGRQGPASAPGRRDNRHEAQRFGLDVPGWHQKVFAARGGGNARRHRTGWGCLRPARRPHTGNSARRAPGGLRIEPLPPGGQPGDGLRHGGLQTRGLLRGEWRPHAGNDRWVSPERLHRAGRRPRSHVRPCNAIRNGWRLSMPYRCRTCAGRTGRTGRAGPMALCPLVDGHPGHGKDRFRARVDKTRSFHHVFGIRLQVRPGHLPLGRIAAGCIRRVRTRGRHSRQREEDGEKARAGTVDMLLHCGLMARDRPAGSPVYPVRQVIHAPSDPSRWQGYAGQALTFSLRHHVRVAEIRSN